MGPRLARSMRSRLLYGVRDGQICCLGYDEYMRLGADEADAWQWFFERSQALAAIRRQKRAN